MQGNEIITFFLGLGAVAFVLLNLGSLRRIPAWWMLFTALGLNLCSWLFTNLEAWFLPQALNIAEHLCSTLDIVVFGAWIVVLLVKHQGRIT